MSIGNIKYIKFSNEGSFFINKDGKKVDEKTVKIFEGILNSGVFVNIVSFCNDKNLLNLLLTCKGINHSTKVSLKEEEKLQNNKTIKKLFSFLNKKIPCNLHEIYEEIKQMGMYSDYVNDAEKAILEKYGKKHPSTQSILDFLMLCCLDKICTSTAHNFCGKFLTTQKSHNNKNFMSLFGDFKKDSSNSYFKDYLNSHSCSFLKEKNEELRIIKVLPEKQLQKINNLIIKYSTMLMEEFNDKLYQKTKNEEFKNESKQKLTEKDLKEKFYQIAFELIDEKKYPRNFSKVLVELFKEAKFLYEKNFKSNSDKNFFNNMLNLQLFIMTSYW